MAVPPIPPGRKVAFYLGTGLMAVGFLLFFSVFIEAGLQWNEPHHLNQDFGVGFLHAFIGIALLAIGRSLRTVGEAGAAGAGLILDPNQARRDLEPLNRAKGGMLKDALDEAGMPLGHPPMPFDEKLRRLHDLHRQGVLTQTEYDHAKQRLLNDPR